MARFLEGRSGIGVHQRRKFFELRNSYTLTDETGQTVGKVEQSRQSSLAFLARLGTSLDVALPVTLEVTDSGGQPVLLLAKPWFGMRVAVSEPGGRVIGAITRRLRMGKPVYALEDGSGAVAGEIKARDWRSRTFTMLDPAGIEMAQVTKQWRGLLTESFTDADSYAVTFSPAATADQRALAFGGALAVDLIQKQKDTS